MRYNQQTDIPGGRNRWVSLEHYVQHSWAKSSILLGSNIQFMMTYKSQRMWLDCCFEDIWDMHALWNTIEFAITLLQWPVEHFNNCFAICFLWLFLCAIQDVRYTCLLTVWRSWEFSFATAVWKDGDPKDDILYKANTHPGHAGQFLIKKGEVLEEYQQYSMLTDAEEAEHLERKMVLGCKVIFSGWNWRCGGSAQRAHSSLAW